MSIDSVAGGSTAQSLYKNQFQQERQLFGQLAQALKSGDLTGAQKAYASLQQLRQQQGQTGPQTAEQALLQKDLTAVGQALQSGDLAGAQKAFAQLKQDIQAARAERQNGSGSSQVSATQSNTTAIDSDGDTDGSSTLNVSA